MAARRSPKRTIIDFGDLQRNGYVVQRELGAGAYGRVFKCTRLADGKSVAVKVIHTERLCAKEINLVRGEIAFLSSVSHPNIVSLVDVSASGDERFLYIVTEYLKGGSLLERVQRNGYLREADLTVVARQLLDALDHMHGLGYAHLDLKLENIVFATKPDDKYQVVKLIDFGSVTQTTADRPLAPPGRLGTLHYTSPQALSKLPYDPFRSDIWSLGVVFYGCLSGAFPFEADGDARLKRIIISHAPHFLEPQWRRVSPKWRMLISRMLEKDVELRLGLAAVNAGVDAVCVDIQNGNASNRCRSSNKGGPFGWTSGAVGVLKSLVA